MVFSLDVPKSFVVDLIAEDGDDISHPNVFSIGNLQSPTLGDIRKVKHERRRQNDGLLFSTLYHHSETLTSILLHVQLFPVPGRYHFRYLKNVGNMTVWMDAVDDTLVVPPFDGRIFMKASRISDAPQRPPSDIPRQQQQSQQQQQQQHHQSPSRNSPSPNNNASRITIPKPPSSSETLLAFGSDDLHEDDMQSANNNQMGGGSFMDSNNNDLIGLGNESSNNNISKVNQHYSAGAFFNHYYFLIAVLFYFIQIS